MISAHNWLKRIKKTLPAVYKGKKSWSKELVTYKILDFTKQNKLNTTYNRHAKFKHTLEVQEYLSPKTFPCHICLLH